MTPLLQEDRFSGFRYHVKVHSFRIITVILAWLFIAAAFYEKPELLTGLQRAIQRGMEAAAALSVDRHRSSALPFITVAAPTRWPASPQRRSS